LATGSVKAAARRRGRPIVFGIKESRQWAAHPGRAAGSAPQLCSAAHAV